MEVRPAQCGAFCLVGRLPLHKMLHNSSVDSMLGFKVLAVAAVRCLGITQPPVEIESVEIEVLQCSRGEASR
ncbi:hypothetical protein CU043_00075 [Corynebacterium striatum]|nr:hypothetical protein [Corynebacterium striatum]